MARTLLEELNDLHAGYVGAVNLAVEQNDLARPQIPTLHGTLLNKNLLRVLNRDLDADVDPGAFEHRAVWDEQHEWIEMRLVSSVDQRVHLGALDLDVAFGQGEQMRTEISSKFRRDAVTAELAAAGLRLTRSWTDPGEDFALSLSVPL